jgi:Xaa-Pro dipeptidase
MIDLDALLRAKTLPFDRAEYDARLARVRQAMARRGIDVLLISEPENMYYLTGYFTTGYWSVQTLAVPLEGEPQFVVRHLERTAVLGTSWLETVEVYLDTQDPAGVIAAVLAKRGWGRARLGVEKHSWYLTVSLFERLQAALPSARFVDASYLVNEVRLVKSPAEIAYLRQAARAAQAAVEAGIAAAEPGKTEADLAIAVFNALVRHGSDRPDLGVIASGERLLLAHGRFTQRRLQPGDPIRFELTGRVGKYNARFMRCAHLGPPPARLQQVSDVAAAALEEALARMKPGAIASEVDRAARDRLSQGGLSVPIRTGYSLGILFVPSPLEWNRDFMPESTWALEAGMTFHMLILAEGLGHSETVVVTPDGHEALTRMDRRLFVRPS